MAEKKKKTWVFGLGAAIVALGTGIVLYFRSERKKGERLQPQAEEIPTYTPPVTSSSPGSGGGRKDSFPLKYGSSGSRVKQMQQLLIKVHGKSILPKYGADGHWGDETQGALVSLGLPTLITQTAFESTLNGPPTTALQTRRETTLWDQEHNLFPVPAGVLVGQILRSDGGITAFRNLRGDTLYGHTRDLVRL